MMKSISLAASLMAAPLASYAQPFNVDALASVGLSGSERLAGFVLTRPGLGDETFLQGIGVFERMGVIGKPGEISRKWLKFSPVVGYDGNLNGGFSNDTIMAGGLPFKIEDRYVALGGLMLGVSANGGLSMNVAQDTALDLRMNAMFGWSPEYDITKSQISGEACIRHMVTTETFVHGCIDAAHSNVELGETNRIGARVGVGHSFASPVGFHDVTVDLRHAVTLGTNGYDQDIIAFRMVSALPGSLAVVLGAQIGSKVDGQHVMRKRIEAGVTTVVAGRPVALMAAAQQSKGGMFLGGARVDHDYTVSLSTSVTEKLSVSASYGVTDSNYAFHDKKSFGISFDFRF